MCRQNAIYSGFELVAVVIAGLCMRYHITYNYAFKAANRAAFMKSWRLPPVLVLISSILLIVSGARRTPTKTLHGVLFAIIQHC